MAKSKEEKNASNKAWREAHKEERKAYMKARYEANKERLNASRRAYYQAHKEEEKVSDKVYYEANKDKINASCRTWHEINKDKRKNSMKVWRESHGNEHRAAVRAWSKENPEKVREYSSRRRAKKASVVNLTIRDNFEAFLKEVWDNKCSFCRNPSDKWHLDHFMPLILNGHHAEYNLVLACPPCNLHKSAKHPFEFIKEQKICFTFKPYMKFPY